MSSLPAVPTDLTPATEGQARAALKGLFDTFFAPGSGDALARYAGYLEVVGGEPEWAISAAVRRFLHGKVSSHDGRFLPTSAELARVVREESALARRMAERKQRPAVMLEDKRDPKITAAEREKRIERLRDLAQMIGGGSESDDELAEPEIAEAAPVGKHLVEALERQGGRNSGSDEGTCGARGQHGDIAEG